MRQINGYWVDENNNKWSCKLCTKGKAKQYSKTLFDCYNCYNCHDCCNCRYCHDCHDCYNCHDCHDCHDCFNCFNCDNCDNCDNCCNCDNCDNCYNCRYCDNCDNCCNCYNCFGCHDYKQNPQRYITGYIGSRNKQTTFYYLGDDEMGDKKTQVVCGCFRGNIEEFEQAVLKTHEDNDEYREQYLKEIAKVKVLLGLE